MKLVYSARDMVQAELAREHLGAHGIDARLLDKHVAQLGGGMFQQALSPSLWVRDSDLERARECLASFEERIGAKPARPCPACGAAIEEQFAMCWSCGAPVHAAVPEVAAATGRELEVETAAAPQLAARSDRALWSEVGVVLMMTMLPSFFAYLVDLVGSPPAYTSGSAEMTYRAFYSLTNIVLVFYLVRRSGEPVSAIGLKPFRWLRDPLLGACLLLLNWSLVRVAFVVLRNLYEPAHSAAGIDAPESSPAPLVSVVAATVIALSAFQEEVIVRGYLLTRLEVLFRSRLYAWLASASLFALWHLYQGPYGVVGALAMGLTMGAAYFTFRSLWPVFLAHFLNNLFVSLG